MLFVSSTSDHCFAMPTFASEGFWFGRFYEALALSPRSSFLSPKKMVRLACGGVKDRKGGLPVPSEVEVSSIMT